MNPGLLKEVVSVDRRCNGTNSAGGPCSAKPVRPDGFCYWHSPALEAERQENRRKGGSARSNVARARRKYAGEAMTMREVQGLLSTALREVLAGETEPGIGAAAATLGRAIAAVAQVGDLEERLAELEQRAGVETRSA